MSIVKVENLTFQYRNDETLIKNLSFDVNQGELFGILGPNGTGKTTLLKLILGFLKPVKGSIELFNRDIRNFREWRRVGYVPQRFSVDKFFTGSVKELFKALRPQRKVGWVIAYLHLEDLLEKSFIKLSGGEQQKVLLALALSKSPDLIILDEPTTGLDIHTLEHIESILRDIKGKKTILLVSHDLGFVLRNADRILCMSIESCYITNTEKLKGMVSELYGLH